MNRILKLPTFHKWMEKIGLSDEILCRAIKEMTNGLVDADLGGGLVKKRISLPGRGKRGSTRTLIATNKKNRWVFLYGFQKNEKTNITHKELEAFQKLSSDFLSFSNQNLNFAIKQKKLLEVSYGSHTQEK